MNKIILDIIDGANVLYYTDIDDFGTYSWSDGSHAVPVKYMAIGRYEDKNFFYLFALDDEKNVVEDYWCKTIEEAMVIVHEKNGRVKWHENRKASGIKKTKKNESVVVIVNGIKYDIEIDGEESCSQLYNIVAANKNIILPNNNDSVWIVWTRNVYQGWIFSYFKKKEQYSISHSGLFYMTIKDVCKKIESTVFHFEYYPSPQARGKKIFFMNDGDNYMIWHEGWSDEYKLCDVTPEMEKEWKKEYDTSKSKH